MEAMVLLAVKGLLVSSPIAAVCLLIWYYTVKQAAKDRERDQLNQKSREESDREIRKREAAEHMEKWNTLVRQHTDEVARMAKTHQEELDRAYRLHERMTEVNELHASLLQSIDSKISNNQFCPTARKQQGKE